LIEHWRFINSGNLPGSRNMALDTALARLAGDGKAQPVGGGMARPTDGGAAQPILRLYGWRPPAISLGFHQSPDDLDLEKCKNDGLDVVMRPTGGRAILHAEELTYAVILPESSRFFQPDIMSVYRLLSRCLVAGLEKVDVDVRFERAPAIPGKFARGELSTMCYASSVQYEIGFAGKKLVGSAQRRFERSVLQHGSILIGRRHLDITRYLSEKKTARPDALRGYLESHTICLNDICKKPVSYDQLVPAVRRGFEEQLGIAFTDSDVTGRESEAADMCEEDHALLVVSG
jgi:lipoate-protein ligase A